jgi:hypothetical protein
LEDALPGGPPTGVAGDRARRRSGQPGLQRRSAADAPALLKDIPRVTPDGFCSWTEQNENETLRFDLNYDLAESLSRAKAHLGRGLARRSVDLLERYVDEATSDISTYDVDEDPKGLVRWEEAGPEIVHASIAPDAPASQDQFQDWLTAMAMTFKTAVEDNGLWRALWERRQHPAPPGEDRSGHRSVDVPRALPSARHRHFT